MAFHYPLSYQLPTVFFNGKYIERYPDESFTKTLRILRSLDVQEVMLAGYVTVESGRFDMDEETKRIGELVRSMGMTPSQNHGMSALYAPLGRSQEPVIERLKDGLRYTANLGAPVLVLHPGFYYAPDFWNKRSIIEVFEEECAKHGTDAVIAQVAANLREVSETAKELHIKIALENVDRFEPMGSPALLPQIIRMADTPEVGFCLDSGHAHCCGLQSVTDWIRAAGDKLFATHFHDNRGARGTALSGDKWISISAIDEHKAPGYGTIPWIDVIRTLHEIGYRDTVNFEFTVPDFAEEEQAYRAAIDFWRTCETFAETEA